MLPCTIRILRFNFCYKGRPFRRSHGINLIRIAGIDSTRSLNSSAIRIKLQIAAIQADGHVAVEIHRAAIRVDGAVVRPTTVAKIGADCTIFNIRAAAGIEIAAIRRDIRINEDSTNAIAIRIRVKIDIELAISRAD